MRRIGFVIALVLLTACPKGEAMVQLKDKWHEVTRATDAASEAAALESWVASARSAHTMYTVSILDGAGNTVPFSEWERSPAQKLTVLLRLEKADETLRWVPVNRSNIAILLRE